MKLYTDDDLKGLSVEELRELHKKVDGEFRFESREIYGNFEPIKKEFDRKREEFDMIERIYCNRKNVRDSEITKLSRTTDYNHSLISYYLDKSN